MGDAGISTHKFYFVYDAVKGAVTSIGPGSLKKKSTAVGKDLDDLK